MLLAVEGGGFFSSSASGYSHGLALLLLGRRTEEKPVRVSPWNQYRLVEREVESQYQLASRKNQVTGGKCASFICFGCTPAGFDGSSPPKADAANQCENLSKLSFSAKGMTAANGASSGNDRKGCLKSSLKRDSSERCMIVNEGEGARESLDKAQQINAFVERRKVHWTDTCGKELVEIREFEASDAGASDDESEHAAFKRCECVIQ